MKINYRHDMNAKLGVVENSLYSLINNQNLSENQKELMLNLAHKKIEEVIELWSEIKNHLNKGE